RRPVELQVVPVALWPAADATGPRILWPDPRYGWDRPALPPPVGRARPSLPHERGRDASRQRASPVLPRRRFRRGPEESSRARRPVRGGAAQESEYADDGGLASRSGRVLRDAECALGMRSADPSEIEVLRCPRIE